jgi:hypothetical protein
MLGVGKSFGLWFPRLALPSTMLGITNTGLGPSTTAVADSKPRTEPSSIKRRQPIKHQPRQDTPLGRRLSYNFLYGFKPRLRSAPPGALPGSGCARAPAFGPLGAAAADARPHVDRAEGHESITT